MYLNLAESYAALWESSDSPPDVFGYLRQHMDASAQAKLVVLLRDQERRWRTDQPLRVEDYMAKLPELDNDVKLQLAVGEFQARQQSGTVPSVDEFVARFPDLDETLRSKISALTSQDGNGAPQPVTTTQTFHSKLDKVRERIGRYRLVRVLGEGGFGRVWLGFDEELQRQVAIKVPTPERFEKADTAEAYLSEARTLATLDHPHIVPVYDVGRTDDGLVYVVSKFIEGGSLAQRIKQTRPGHEEAAKLVATIAEALHHAHLKRLIHRDVKPANILIEESTGRAYASDFGLAIREEDYLRSGSMAVGAEGIG